MHVTLSLSPIKYVINVFPDVGSQAQEFAVDSVESGFQEVSLPGVFTVKQI